MSAIREWSNVAAGNDDASPDGFPEGMAPSGVNNSAREMMAAIKTQAQIAEWTDWGHDPTYVSGTSFTVATDLTAEYLQNRRVKLFGTTMGTLYGTISSSSYGSPNTTVNVTLDSGALTSNLSTVSLSILTPDATNSIPEGLVLAVAGLVVAGVLTATGGIKTDGTNTLKTKVIDIGDWDMIATTTVNIAHGLTQANIRTIGVRIRNDSAGNTYDAIAGSAIDGNTECVISTDSTNIILSRRASGDFDGASFDSTSYNRGWITITYIA